MFLVKTELQSPVSLLDLFNEYQEYVRKYASTRFIFGRRDFCEMIKEFGVRRVKHHKVVLWILPEKYYHQDLLDLMERRVEVIKEKWKIKEERGDKK